MNLLSDVITYIRRIIKFPSNTSITDDLLIDYINRFWINDVDPSMQLFDFKTKYQFQTTPGVDQYNMPLYSIQTESGGQSIGMYPVYQGFLGPCYVNGVQIPFQTQKGPFFNAYPNIVQYMVQVATGDGTQGPYQITLPLLGNNNIPQNPPVNSLLRGHVDISGVIATGLNVDPPIANNTTFASMLGAIPTTSIESRFFLTTTAPDGSNMIVQDSGVFLEGNVNYGLLIEPGKAPYGNAILPDDGANPAYSTTSNTINYFNGVANVIFPDNVPSGNPINAQAYFFASGLPRAVLFYNNTLTLRVPPAFSYLVEIDAYLSPAAFFSTSQAIPFGYMSEYLSLGAARKILSDTGDVEQFQFYEPRYQEQKSLVKVRHDRQFTATRTQTIYSQGDNTGTYGWGNYSSGGM